MFLQTSSIESQRTCGVGAVVACRLSSLRVSLSSQISAGAASVGRRAPDVVADRRPAGEEDVPLLAVDPDARRVDEAHLALSLSPVHHAQRQISY